MTAGERSLKLHEEARGKLSMESKVRVESADDLSIAYTPGVAQPCLKIQEDPTLAYKYTIKGSLIAVVTDGSAVLGLGNIGALAGMPVMEGKAVLFKRFAGLDAFPICLATQDTDEIVETVARIAPGFGGINLEDISSPRCFEVERRLKEMLDIPVFHDDQHGTAIIVAAALKNALKLVGKKLEDAVIVINGIGAAGSAICALLHGLGAKHFRLCDRYGMLRRGEAANNSRHEELAKLFNPNGKSGTLADALRGADVFIGVSAPGIVSESMVSSMARDSILFAMANPVPEIMPNLARKAGAAVVGTGRSDFPNQVNNCLAFPGVFKGAMSVRARQINEAMKYAAVDALAQLAEEQGLNAEHILPSALDPQVAQRVADAVAEAAVRTGEAQCPYEK